MIPSYAELHCQSNFSFLTGASHPEELVARAAQLGYRAIAITDECSVAGVVRAHEEAKRQKDAGTPIQLLIGARFHIEGDGATPGCQLVLIAQDKHGYGNLCELITLARLRRPKGTYHLTVRDLDAPTGNSAHLRGLPRCQALLIPRRDDPPEVLLAQARWLADTFAPDTLPRASLAIELLHWADDGLLSDRLQTVSRATGVPLAAAGAVQMHVRSRKPLHDTLTAIRLNQPISTCGHALARNAEQHLRSRLALAQVYRPAWLAQTLRIAGCCTFSLSELRYDYPDEIVPPGHTATSYLRQETLAGAQRRYPQGIPPKVQAQLETEFALIAELRYEAFFLTVYDIVLFARRQQILCQGRGSSANSAVCFCLGITEVNPAKATLLFGRFLSRERNEPPDIDVDFEHERREEVIQYIYGKYGIERTALAAALSTYRTRGAVRDVGKALGLDTHLIDAVAKSHQWFDSQEALTARLTELGLDPASPVTQHWLELGSTLHGFPRHLSQHSGGFVISGEKLSRLVPIEPAAMDNRRIIQWDKDDLESLGLLKVDVLALGMLTTLRKTFSLLQGWTGRPWCMQDIGWDDAATYEMTRRADTVGVFQIESRAQQSMLPRLRPDKFYDLVVQVAIVRPGPIQGGMVHPYLRRKMGQEAITCPEPLKVALERTMGVPIFQEQVMQVCMIAADFTAGEADELRRAMAAWRRKGGVDKFKDRVINRMVANGYEPAFAEAIFRQIEGFGEYGFPESHAEGFALLAYFSAWLKCHHPAAFTAALINSQPMGFYQPAQLIQDAQRHGVRVLPADVLHSDWDCTLETDPHADANPQRPTIRLGLRLVKGLSEAAAQRLVQARTGQADESTPGRPKLTHSQPKRSAGHTCGQGTAAKPPGGPFHDLHDLALRAALDPRDLQALARADALRGLAGHRRQQVWATAAPAAGAADSLLRAAPVHEAQLSLLPAAEGEAIALDYAATGLTLGRHPLALLRPRLAARGVRSATELASLGHLGDGRSVRAGGLVISRQQPGTAKGTIFVTLEDETGPINVIVWKDVRDAYRQPLLSARLLLVAGTWQQRDGVSHLVAKRLFDASAWLGRLAREGSGLQSRDFH
ncbi:MAG: error-prone DNA polymerase [Burkholderiales bacterium]